MSGSVKKGLSRLVPSRASKVGVVLSAVIVGATSAMAGDATTLKDAAGGFTVDVSPLYVMMATILTAIGAIWAIKKMVALGNKS